MGGAGGIIVTEVQQGKTHISAEENLHAHGGTPGDKRAMPGKEFIDDGFRITDALDFGELPDPEPKVSAPWHGH